jgi:hypothetical protein
MYADVWFKLVNDPTGECLLIAGLSDATADRLADALNDEFGDIARFWAE